MPLDGRGGVAQRLGKDRHGSQPGELVERAKPGRACAEYLPKAIAEMAGVDVATGGVAAEDPVAVRVCSSQVVAGVSRQTAPRPVERGGQSDLYRPDLDSDTARR